MYSPDKDYLRVLDAYNSNDRNEFIGAATMLVLNKPIHLNYLVELVEAFDKGTYADRSIKMSLNLIVEPYQ
jgi:hypothetical protein